MMGFAALYPSYILSKGKIPALALTVSSIDRPLRRFIRQLAAGRAHQAAAPELPRPLVNPPRLGLKHGFGKPIAAQRLLQQPDLLETRHAHRPSQNSGIRTGLRTDWFPPEKPLLQFRQKPLGEAAGR